MDNSALNKAHQQHRLADKHLRYRRYSEAIACHISAVELLTDALKCTDNPRSLESIKLQIDFHGRQKNIINMKKEQHEQYKMSFENKYSNMGALGCDDCDGNILTDAIYQTIEETDSLIDLMQNQRQHSDNNSTKSTASDNINEANESKINLAVKHPKDDKTVIEEFKILNKQLHLLVSQLVNQLENSKKENDLLKSRLKQYEYEKLHNNQNSNNLKVTTDSSGGTSPYVYSPYSEFSPDVQDQNPLPLLAIPNMNFRTQNFDTSASTSSITSNASNANES